MAARDSACWTQTWTSSPLWTVDQKVSRLCADLHRPRRRNERLDHDGLPKAAAAAGRPILSIATPVVRSWETSPTRPPLWIAGHDLAAAEASNSILARRPVPAKVVGRGRHGRGQIDRVRAQHPHVVQVLGRGVEVATKPLDAALAAVAHLVVPAGGQRPCGR